MPLGENNLLHALANDCTDPDCEIHNPEIGESTTPTDNAFYYAGACFLADLLSGLGVSAYDLGTALAELRDQRNLNGR